MRVSMYCLALIVLVLGLGVTDGFLKNACRFRKILLSCHSSKLKLASGEGEGDEARSAPAQPQMEVVPFDFVDEFAKEDLPMEKIMGNAGKGILEEKKKREEKGGGVPQLGGKEKPLEQRLQEAYQKNLNIC